MTFGELDSTGTKYEHWSRPVNEEPAMSALPEQKQEDENERLEVATDQAIEACGGDLRSTIRALILVTEYLEHELEAKVSVGYVRGGEIVRRPPLTSSDDM
jgi:hypothetical protein